MKIIIASIIVLVLVFTTLPLFTKVNVVTYHMEFKNWPDSMKPMIDSVVKNLTVPNQCWTYNDKPVANSINELPADTVCKAYVTFADDKKIVTQNKTYDTYKYLISYSVSKDGQEKMLLKLFKPDGKNLRGIALTSFDLKNETVDTLQHRIILWSMK